MNLDELKGCYKRTCSAAFTHRRLSLAHYSNTSDTLAEVGVEVLEGAPDLKVPMAVLAY